jgi:DNA-binding phage protein
MNAEQTIAAFLTACVENANRNPETVRKALDGFRDFASANGMTDAADHAEILRESLLNPAFRDWIATEVASL